MGVDIGGVTVHGRFDERFSEVAEVFAENIESGLDVGASFALSHEGEMVVDIWGGHLDEAKESPWQEDTIVNVYSSTKTVSFLCALLLADRQLLDFDAPVADYWPEFAAAGKEAVKVWHLMDHAAGLSGMDEPLTSDDFYDWDKMTSLLAAQAPWWEPGTATGYHALTQGYLIGEVVRRITGKSLGQFLREEVAEPLNADFFIGVPESEFPRIGNLMFEEEFGSVGGDAEAGSIAARTFRNPQARAGDSWTKEWRMAEIPAANGHGNARSLVRLQTPLACGGAAFGVDLLGEDTARSVMIPRIEGTDQVLGLPVTFGLGFALNLGPVPLSPNKNACFWAGWGGSTILVDQDARVAVSFVMNKMFPGLVGDTRSYKLTQTAFGCLD